MTIQAQAAPGPAALRYVNAVLGILREGGFSVEQTHHAQHILGSRLLGFSQEPFDDSGDLGPAAAAALGGCDDGAEFELALDFMLDGLARMRSAASGAGG